jgi:LacI family transcriptional regulator
MGNITIKDIAKICNVGIGTVSRAINDDPGINVKTKERILKVINECGYVPNNSARNLKLSDSNTIALLVKGIDNQFFQGMLKIFHDELEKIKYSFIVQSVAEDQDDVSVALQLAKEKKLKGIIFLGGLIDHADERLKYIGIPYILCTVAVNKDTPERQCSSISIDDELESYKAVDYLCKMGHRKIAMITGRETDYAVGRLRQEGYMRALADHGIDFDPELVRFMKDDIQEYTVENGYAVMKELLEKDLEFTALYAVSDITAFGAYKAIMEKGLRIPEDISVMGFDGLDVGKYYHPSLTTMKQPAGEMVRESIRLLMKQIDGDKEHHKVLLEAKLLERDSVKKIN